MDHLLEYSSHHPWLVALLVASGVAVAFYELRARFDNAGALAPQEVVRLMNQGAALLDVRPEQAYSQGHISGARRFDATQIDKAADSLKRYKERPVIVYAEAPGSAAAAVRALARQGFTKVFNLRGGLAAWRAEKLPLARD